MPVRDLRSISTWLKIALICISLGVLLFVIGFATESWMVAGTRYRWLGNGLWKYKHCSGSSCQSGKYNTYSLEGKSEGSAQSSRLYKGLGGVGWGWGAGGETWVGVRSWRGKG